MCLWIESDQSQNEKDLKKWLGSRKKFAYVYKILVKREEESFYRSLVYSDFIWDFSKQKIFQVDRDPKPTELELEVRRIYKGLHAYTNLETTRSCLEKNNVVVKLRVRKEDIVAIENHYNDKDFDLKELVCTRLEFVKVIES
jgi:hypothetical protein